MNIKKYFFKDMRHPNDRQVFKTSSMSVLSFRI